MAAAMAKDTDLKDERQSLLKEEIKEREKQRKKKRNPNRRKLIKQEREREMAVAMAEKTNWEVLRDFNDMERDFKLKERRLLKEQNNENIKEKRKQRQKKRKPKDKSIQLQNDALVSGRPQTDDDEVLNKANQSDCMLAFQKWHEESMKMMMERQDELLKEFAQAFKTCLAMGSENIFTNAINLSQNLPTRADDVQ